MIKIEKLLQNMHRVAPTNNFGLYNTACLNPTLVGIKMIYQTYHHVKKIQNFSFLFLWKKMSSGVPNGFHKFTKPLFSKSSAWCPWCPENQKRSDLGFTEVHKNYREFSSLNGSRYG